MNIKENESRISALPSPFVNTMPTNNRARSTLHTPSGKQTSEVSIEDLPQIGYKSLIQADRMARTNGFGTSRNSNF